MAYELAKRTADAEQKLATRDGLPARDGALLSARLQRRYQDRITGSFAIPGREGRYAPIPDSVPPALAAALKARGIEQLYSHQAEAWEASQRGEHVAIVTPTASGKSLCYTLPVVSAAMQDKAKALYLFPTKALAQDQVAELLELNRAGDLGVKAFTFDGDTPAMRAGDPPAWRHRGVQPGHAAPGHPAASHRGHSSSRTCATSSSTRCTPIAACSAATSPTCCAGSSASARSMACNRSSSCARPPSATRRHMPRR